LGLGTFWTVETKVFIVEKGEGALIVRVEWGGGRETERTSEPWVLEEQVEKIEGSERMHGSCFPCVHRIFRGGKGGYEVANPRMELGGMSVLVGVVLFSIYKGVCCDRALRRGDGGSLGQTSGVDGEFILTEQ